MAPTARHIRISWVHIQGCKDIPLLLHLPRLSTKCRCGTPANSFLPSLCINTALQPVTVALSVQYHFHPSLLFVFVFLIVTITTAARGIVFPSMGITIASLMFQAVNMATAKLMFKSIDVTIANLIFKSINVTVTKANSYLSP